MNKNKFIPYYNKIHVKLFEEESMLQSENKNYMQMGTVVAVGRDVKFAKVGDFIYFLQHGCETTPEYQSETYHVVTDSPNIILGRYGRDKK